MNHANDEPFFQPGRNCASVRHADRFSLLIDGADYFRVLREALTRAERTVFILGWDIDSRMKLTPEGADDGYPEALGDFLHALAGDKRRLRVYILAWDFAMLYAFEREWLPVYKMGWRTHRRIAFQMDGKHPLGGSQHQKIVVIDDRVAFVGGLDLTRSRWDTSAHAPDEPLRRDANGAAYQPFHDVHTMFDGDAAREIGQLARERWARACGKRLAIRAHRAEAKAVADRMGLTLDLKARVADLALADRQMVAIARAMAHQPKVLILDEPTSSLSSAEADRLFALIDRLRGQGVAILYISHRMSDIRRLADRIVSMRDGIVSGVFDHKPLDYEGAVNAMLGRKIHLDQVVARQSAI